MTLLHRSPARARLLPLLRYILVAPLLLFAAVATAQDWTYRVRPGDTLWDLGALYLKPHVSWQQLQAHNTVADPYHMPPGLVLRFPIAWLRVQPAPARVLAVRGPVRVDDPTHGSRSVQAGMRLPIGSQIQTGANASVTLAFADDSRLLLRENAQLLMDQLSSYGAAGMVDTRLRLQRGRSSSRVTPARGPASRYMIVAPTATSSVRGTVFRVSAGNDTLAAATEVVEGRVEVSNAGGKQVVDPGHASLSPTMGSGPQMPRPLLPAPTLAPLEPHINALPLQASWQAVSGAAAYRLEVVQADAPEILLFAQDLTTTQARIDDLPPGQLRLLVRAIADDGVEGRDAEHDFVVADGPDAPLTIAPLHGQLLHLPRPRFEWASVAGASGSVLQVATEPQFLQPVFELRTGGTRLRVPDALAAGEYFWRVASLDAHGRQGRYGEALPLRISDASPDPQLRSDRTADGRLTIRWQAESDAQRYRVQVARDAGFTRMLLDEDVTTPEVALKRPLRGGTLFIRVQTIDDDGYARPFSLAQQVRLPCRLCYGVGAGALLLLLL